MGRCSRVAASCESDVIEHSFSEGNLLVAVQIVPRASKSEIVGEFNGLLRVRVAAPPVEGAANKELVRVLAKRFKVARSAVTLLSGENSRVKRLRIEKVDLKLVNEILAGDNR